MSGVAARAAFAGEEAGLVAGVSWLPIETLEALVDGTTAATAPEALEALVRALELDFAFVPAHEPWAADAVVRLHDAGAAAVWAVSGVLGRVGHAVGWSEVLRLSASEPADLAISLAEVLHDALEEVREAPAARADAVLIADDLAGASGPLVAPDFALDALVPCYQSLASAAHEAEVGALFHSDGDIRALMPALSRAGYSGLHLGGLGADSFAGAYGVARALGLVLLGGFEASTIVTGARRAGAHAAGLALAGGLVLCDDGGLTTVEEIAAYASALEAARAAYEAGRVSDA